MRLAFLVVLLPLATAAAWTGAPAAGAPPYVLGHDHRNAALHDDALGLAETDWEPMGGTAATMAGAHALALANGVLFVAAWGEQFGAGGLWLYDVATDPHDPALISYVPLPGPVGGDRALAVTPDGAFAVVGVEDVPVTLYWGAPANPTPPGLVLVDARIPLAAHVVGYAPAELGIHSVTMHRVAGVDHVYATNLGFTTPSIYRLEREPAPRLVPRNPLAMEFRIGHDAAGYHDTQTGGDLLATADGGSYNVWDLVDPYRPRHRASWPAFGTYAHSALLTSIEGQRVLVASSEDWENVGSRFWLVNMTNFASPRLLGTWQAPVPAGPGWLQFSLHNPRVLDGTLYFAHYHAGVVAFDVSTLAKAASPQMVAYAVTGHDTGYVSAGAQAMTLVGWGGVSAPYVLDIELDSASGALYAADPFFGVTTYATR